MVGRSDESMTDVRLAPYVMRPSIEVRDKQRLIVRPAWLLCSFRRCLSLTSFGNIATFIEGEAAKINQV